MRKYICYLILISLFTACQTENYRCYTISRIIPPDGVSSVVFNYYEIREKSLIEKIKGDLLVDNIYESKLSKVIFINKQDTIESTKTVRIKKSKLGINLVYGTSRFEITDSMAIFERVKNEKIILNFINGQQVILNRCE
ncbi:MAG: hypothetical protein JKY22_02440 [Flavobacteriaceae bacterium]|nr:hypothetical protein [Flavobacteriaceae bacterium]